MSQFNGYTEADRIDRKIGELAEKTPITADTAHGWRNFIRQVRSTLDILQDICDDATDAPIDENPLMEDQ